jgi:predicted O-methyltransferase YrrM
MAKATAHRSFITIEGDPVVSRLARGHLGSKVQVINGPFEAVLADIISTLPYIDFVFIDGNHTKSATLKYFDLLIKKSNKHTCLLFDDIYWNEDMNAAWKKILIDERVSISIDLFHFGLVFTRPFQQKQHFQLKPGFI